MSTELQNSGARPGTCSLTFKGSFATFLKENAEILSPIGGIARGMADKIALSGFRETAKPKDIIITEHNNLYVQRFGATGSGRGARDEKAAITNDICSFLFEYLQGFRIPTCFVEKKSATDMVVKPVTPLHLTTVVWNVAARPYSTRYGLKENSELLFPVIEHYYKKASLGNPLVGEFHVYQLGLATPEQLRQMNRLASKANAVLRPFFERRNLKLVSMTLTFGVTGDEQVVISDEISPRTCTFIDTLDAKRDSRKIAEHPGDLPVAMYRKLHERILRAA